MIVAVVVWTMSLKPYLPVTSLLKYHPTKGRSNIIIDITDSESLCTQLEQRWWTKNGASVLKSQQSWVCIQPSDHFQSCVVMFTFLSLKHMANMLWQSVPCYIHHLNSAVLPLSCIPISVSCIPISVSCILILYSMYRTLLQVHFHLTNDWKSMM